MEAQFVPGTNPVCPSQGRRAAQKVYVLKDYMPFSLAIKWPKRPLLSNVLVDLRATFAVALPRELFLMSFFLVSRLVVCGPQGFYNRSRTKTSDQTFNKIEIQNWLEPRDPLCLAEESTPSPAQKVKKESPGESPGESPRVLADPPKRVKNECLDSENGIFDSQSLQETRFWLFLGGWPGPSETLPETLLWLFEPGRVLTPLPGGAIATRTLFNWEQIPTNFTGESHRPWPRCFWKVSRYTSHFYRDTFAKVCPSVGRK